MSRPTPVLSIADVNVLKAIIDLGRNFGTKNLAKCLKIWLDSAHKFQNI